MADPANDSQAPTISEIRAIGKKHRKMALCLTIILCFPAFGFALSASYFPALMDYQILPGLSLLLLAYYSLIGFCFIISGIYVWLTGRFYDRDWMLKPFTKEEL
jgi:uncharacterized membrane protein (DUF485 family)